MRRRAFLRAGCAAGCLGLAGCSSVSGGSDGPGGSDESTTDPAAAGAESTTGTPTRSATATASPTPEPTPTGPTPAASGTVGMSCDIDGPVDEYYFTPPVTWVEVGATVSWAPTSPCRQQTLAFHPDNDLPLRMPGTAEPWQSPVVQGTGQQSSQFTHTFEQPGVYNYAGLHEEFGQVGIVVVGRPGDPDSEPGLQPPKLDGASPQSVERLRFLVDEVRELLGVEDR